METRCEDLLPRCVQLCVELLPHTPQHAQPRLPAECELHRRPIVRMPGDLHIEVWAQHHGDVQDLLDVYVKRIPFWIEGKAGLTVPLKEETLALAASKRQRHRPLRLVGLPLDAQVLEWGNGLGTKHVNLRIVEPWGLAGSACAHPCCGRSSIGAAHVLAVHIAESDLPIPSGFVALAAARREVGGVPARYCHTFKPLVQLRRLGFR
mmetsp:Transcript_117392/g.292684  ORF Transcript_117392/g.292684 Transcript_117392/m.292684 type:complete len:207 (-) Transcript_117392:1415-2035(-)